MSGRITAEVATTTLTAVKSVLYKPLPELTEDDISQLTREDCRRFLKEKGMRRPSWNKSQAIQQVISLKSLLEPSPPPNASVKLSFRPPPMTNNNATVNSSPSSTIKELSPAGVEGFVAASVEDRFSNQQRKPLHLDVARDGEYLVDDTRCSHDRVNVYDGVPIDKAGSILHIAACPNQFCEEEPSGENLPNLNTPCQGCSSSVNLNFASPDSPSLQAIQPEKFAEPDYYRSEGNNPHEQDVESQTNRQVSLLRYFEKRKDRGKFKMKRKIGTSSSGLEMYLRPQMHAAVSNMHNSESNASTTNYLGLPQTDCETKGKYTKNPGLSVDLNDKGTGLSFLRKVLAYLES